MELNDLVSPDAIIPSMRAKDKKHALHDLAEAAGRQAGLPARELFDSFLQRERLGSTGVGRGIAIPHLRVASLKKIVCVFARLQTPIQFDSLDGEDVDLIFALLTPEQAGGDHLKALARISRLMREPATTQKLRASKDRAALHAVLTEAMQVRSFPLAG
jgi:PTS system nitrogen regulatory IIA component